MNRGLLDEIENRLLKRIRDSLRNMVARGVVQLVDDTKKAQLVQLGVLAGETVEGPAGGAEHFQAYGFSSSPLPGAEAVVVFVGGDRGHPITIATGDRRYRPTGGKPGEVTVYNNTGAKVTITKDGDIIATPASGRSYLVSDEPNGASANELGTKADLTTLKNAISSAAVSPGDGGATFKQNLLAALSSWPLGTRVLKGK